MSPVPTRRSWLPGGALLVAAVLVAGLSGFALGVRSWPWYVGFAAAAILAIGWAERVWTRRRAPAPARIRGKLKVIQGGKAAPYDLAKDHSTDSQRYLM
jgi:protein-S-isoprenylcysteine O-methyltransferase Ste14